MASGGNRWAIDAGRDAGQLLERVDAHEPLAQRTPASEMRSTRLIFQSGQSDRLVFPLIELSAHRSA